MKEIVHFSRFVPVTHLGGGARRTRQMVKVLEPFRPQMISSARAGGIRNLSPGSLGFFDAVELFYYFDHEGKLKCWSTFDLETISRTALSESNNKNNKKLDIEKLKTIFTKKKKGIKYWSSLHREKIGRFWSASGEWARKLDLSRLSLALVDDPIYFLPLVEKLKKAGIPMVAVSHNIESLAAHQAVPRYQGNLFNRELAALAKCDLVVTISSEEAWLLRNFNINALFLPYYPVEEILSRMLKIRDKRKKSKKRDFLIIGSVINEATRQGMLAVLNEWKKKKLHRAGDRLLIAGFRSDIFLKDLKNEEDGEFLGELPDEELDKIMGTVKAHIIYQEQGSGALTRIMETLTAGVPALVNTHAARSYHNMAGVVEFQDLDELGSVIKEAGRIDKPVPLPAAPDPTHMVTEIKKLIHN